MKKHKHKFEPCSDFTQSIEIDGRFRNTRVQREQCSCGAYWNHPLHLSAAERGDDIDGYYGVTWTNQYQDPLLYEDVPPRSKPEVNND